MTEARPRTRITRECADCGATPDLAKFPTARPPRKRRDQCTACARDPIEGFEQRVAARRAEIAAQRAAGNYLVQKPAWGTPLFRGLRDRGETEREAGAQLPGPAS